MAHSLSAKKRIRQNVKRNSRNRRRKQQIKDAVREFEDALLNNKTKDAAELLKIIYKRLDKTAARGTIHKSAAARKKAKFAKRLAAAAK